MEKGWDAKERLKPLWGKVGGRDGLAALTGITGQTLSAYNSGSRPLGIVNGRRIADALGVSVLELGAPLGMGDQARDQTVLGRLLELAATVDDLLAVVDELKRRVARLEAPPASRRRVGGGR